MVLKVPFSGSERFWKPMYLITKYIAMVKEVQWPSLMSVIQRSIILKAETSQEEKTLLHRITTCHTNARVNFSDSSKFINALYVYFS